MLSLPFGGCGVSFSAASSIPLRSQSGAVEFVPSRSLSSALIALRPLIRHVHFIPPLASTSPASTALSSARCRAFIVYSSSALGLRVPPSTSPGHADRPPPTPRWRRTLRATSTIVRGAEPQRRQRSRNHHLFSSLPPYPARTHASASSASTRHILKRGRHIICRPRPFSPPFTLLLLTFARMLQTERR